MICRQKGPEVEKKEMSAPLVKIREGFLEEVVCELVLEV